MFFLFLIFSIFTHKQFYAAGHFTGSSKTMPVILLILSILNILLEIAFVVYHTICTSFWFAPLSIICAILANSILNTLLSKIVLNRLVKEGYSPTDVDFIYTYNAECDIASTVIAEIGILANIAIAVFYILSAL